MARAVFAGRRDATSVLGPLVWQPAVPLADLPGYRSSGRQEVWSWRPLLICVVWSEPVFSKGFNGSRSHLIGFGRAVIIV